MWSIIEKRPREGFFLRKDKLPNHMLNYLKDVQAEMKHVSWPSRTQTIAYTVVVIAVSLFTALYLGAWDYLFTSLIQKIV